MLKSIISEGKTTNEAIEKGLKQLNISRDMVDIKILENGEKIPADVKTGDQVMFEKYAGTEVKFEGKEYLIVAGKDIMAWRKK